MARIASTSAAASARRRAISSSSSAGRPSGPGAVRATSTSSSSRRARRTCSDMNAVPRSKLSVAIATRQPSVSLPTTLERDTHVVVEHLAEVAVAGEGLDGADVEAGRIHRTDHPRDAGVRARRVRVGANQELLELRHVTEAGPDLLAVHDQVV